MRLCLALALVCASTTAAWAEPRWEQISDDDGVVVWQRDVPGTSLVEFRGRGEVRASIKHLLAILRDQTRKTEWMANCVDNRALAYVAKNRMVIYNRIASPAPFVSDRDIVLDSHATFDLASRTVELQFREAQHPNMPPIDGVVRMPRTRGYWRFRYLDAERTEVTYQVQADPGGSIPQWLVNMASKSLPFKTLQGLRAQSKKGGYDSELAFLEAAYDWAALEAQAKALASGTSTAAQIVAD